MKKRKAYILVGEKDVKWGEKSLWWKRRRNQEDEL